MSASSEKETGWGGDSNAEWLDLAAETASIGTWEFDLEQGTGFISEQCAEITGYPKALRGQLVQLNDWLSLMRPEDRKRVNQACDPRGEGELKLRLQLVSTGSLVRNVLLRGRCFFASSHFSGNQTGPESHPAARYRKRPQRSPILSESPNRKRPTITVGGAARTDTDFDPLG